MSRRSDDPAVARTRESDAFSFSLDGSGRRLRVKMGRERPTACAQSFLYVETHGGTVVGVHSTELLDCAQRRAAYRLLPAPLALNSQAPSSQNLRQGIPTSGSGTSLGFPGYVPRQLLHFVRRARRNCGV